jgi:hypothetical protein
VPPLFWGGALGWLFQTPQENPISMNLELYYKIFIPTLILYVATLSADVTELVGVNLSAERIAVPNAGLSIKEINER